MNKLIKTIKDIPEKALSDFYLISDLLKYGSLYVKWNIHDDSDLQFVKELNKDPNCEATLHGFEYFKEKSSEFVTIEKRYDLLSGEMKDKKTGWYLVSSQESFIELWNLSGPNYCCRVLETGKDIEEYTFEIQSYEHLQDETAEERLYGGHAIQVFERT